jgi:hypothetical protein
MYWRRIAKKINPGQEQKERPLRTENKAIASFLFISTRFIYFDPVYLSRPGLFISTRFIYLDPVYLSRPGLFISTRFIYLDPVYLFRPGLFISTRFINVDPVYKRPKLLRFLLNLNF